MVLTTESQSRLPRKLHMQRNRRSLIGQKVGRAHYSDVLFQGFFHANGTAKAFFAIWTPKGGHEV